MTGTKAGAGIDFMEHTAVITNLVNIGVAARFLGLRLVSNMSIGLQLEVTSDLTFVFLAYKSFI